MRQRFQFKFWLDVNKPNERELAQHLEDLKRERKFAPTLRDALRLFLDLKEGRTDVLRELFPGIGLAPSMDFEAMIQRAADATAEKVAIATKPLTIQQGLPNVEAPALASGNLKQLSGASKTLPGPSDDDLMDLLEVKQATDTGGQAAQNFINSMMALQSTPAKTK